MIALFGRGSAALASIVACLLVIASAHADGDPEAIPNSVLRSAAERGYSSEQLAQYDGSDGSRPLLMGVRGFVFDVSAGDRFYGPDASYHALIARDASRAVARMSIDASDLNDQCDSLDGSEWRRLESVLRETYLVKYPVVGHVTGGYFYPTGLCCGDTVCGACEDSR